VIILQHRQFIADGVPAMGYHINFVAITKEKGGLVVVFDTCRANKNNSTFASPPKQL